MENKFEKEYKLEVNSNTQIFKLISHGFERVPKEVQIDEEELFFLEKGFDEKSLIEIEERYLRALFKLENGNYILLEHEVESDEDLKNEDFYIDDIEDLMGVVDPKELKSKNNYVISFNEVFYKAKKELIMKKNIILFISHIPYTTKDYILIEDEKLFNKVKKNEEDFAYYLGKYIFKCMKNKKKIWKYAKIKNGNYRKVRVNK